MLLVIVVAVAMALIAQMPGKAAAPKRAKLPKSVRLYVFDCGRLKVEDPVRFNFKKEELSVLDLSAPCFLIAHPKGTLMWDVGVVPDSAFKAAGGPATKEYATATKPLLPQLAAAGYTPADITYLVLSHVHWDHVANVSLFANSTWLVRKVERDAMFADTLPPRTDRSMFEAMRNTKTVIITSDDYDVFGDGTVVIKSTPGHTPGHQSLFVKLARTGPVVLAGDLYHYPEELKAKRVPAGDFDKQQTLASRAALEAFLKQSGSQLWIQHDLAKISKLKKAPEFYD
jgi:glyoxylase-like metal-dependent hydrolase (beta-lactamase superfamily II)